MENIILGNRIFITSRCKVQDQGGVTIGDDAVVAVASVVTKDVPAGTVAAGSCRMVRLVTG